MNKGWLLPLGVLTFAITLAIMLRDSLTGDARLIAIGVILGLIVGVPAGMLSMMVASKMHLRAPASRISPDLGAPSPDQAETVFSRQEASADQFGLPSHRERRFSAVGGADLPNNPPSDQG